MNLERQELEDSFEHAGASYRMWLHLPHDIWGDRISGVVAATVTRTSPGPWNWLTVSAGPISSSRRSRLKRPARSFGTPSGPERSLKACLMPFIPTLRETGRS